MWIRLCLALALMAPGMAGAQLPGDQLHSARIQAFSLCSHLLAYYNPNQDGIDLRYADAYRQGLQQLQRQVRQDPALTGIVEDMAGAISALEAVPAEQPELYPEWLTLVLMAQARFDQQLAEREAGSPTVAPPVASVQALRLDIERLLLLYQSRAFGLLGMYVLVVDEDTVTQLDARILGGFAELQAQGAAPDSELAKLQGYYSFIRPHLLEQQRGWVPGSAAFYLRQASQGLAGLLPEPAAGLQ